MSITAIATAVIGVAWGVIFTRDLIRGRHWSAAGDTGIGIALLNLVTMSKGPMLEHWVIIGITPGLVVASMAAFAADRRDGQRGARGFPR